ncbi:MAG: phospholipid/cholesterol/gamma-HCH transport system substrate-binding protein [Thermodesulfobacteriota bacterium]|nr:phospholipid/cholesterol/gamma-HCH transport system substrate-binding protein [Thermodesulfobacteriota bacterium]
MRAKSTKLKIGLFLVASLLLTVSMLIWLGASRYFENPQTVVAYFSESVQGLESDSPVKFRGVPVGRVKKIRMAPDGLLVEVVMGLNRNFKLSDDLGIKMNLLGLTGLKYLEIDTFKPDQYKEPIELDFTPRYKVIPTYSSDIKEIGAALENIFQKLKALDIERMSNHLLRVSSKLDKILSDSKVDSIGADASEAIREIKEASKKINDDLARAQLGKSITKTLEKTNEFLQASTETMRNADRMIRRTDNNISLLTQKLDRSADNLIDFTRMIKNKPSSIIFGPGEKSGESR